MHTVIIADDRAYERERLQNIINWKAMNMCVTGCAKNGREALNLCLETHPDIVVTDIKMPLMSGVELARALFEQLPLTQIIFLSGYDDFAYARSAIEYNVCAYILKPYTENELTEALMRAVNILEENAGRVQREEHLMGLFSENLSALRESFIYDVISSGSSIPEKEFWERCNLLGLYFEYDLFTMLRINFPFSLNVRSRRELIEAVVEKCVSPFSKGYFLLFDSCFGYLLLNLDENAPSQQTAEAISSLSDMLIREFGANGINLSVDAGSQGYGYISWNRIYSEFSGGDAYVGENAVDSFYRRYKEAEPELFEALEHDQPSYAFNFIDELIDNAEALGLTPNHTTRLCLSFYSETAKRIGEKKPLLDNEISRLLELRTLEDTRQWLKNLTSIAKKIISSQRSGKNKNLISRVLEIIENRYSEPIDVSSISSELYISPNYLRHLFKESQGKSLSSYLTEYRLEHACSLLRSTGCRISDIPQMVGMENNSNFYLLIKKKTGLTPSEYRALFSHEGDAEDAE